MTKHESTLPVAAFEGLIQEMYARASAELDATRARLQALDDERDPPG